MRAGVRIVVYTLNSDSQWDEVTALGVDGIVTDDPGTLSTWQQARRRRTVASRGIAIPEVPCRVRMPVTSGCQRAVAAAAAAAAAVPRAGRLPAGARCRHPLPTPSSSTRRRRRRRHRRRPAHRRRSRRTCRTRRFALPTACEEHLLRRDAGVAPRSGPPAERPRGHDELDPERRRPRDAHVGHPDDPLLVGGAERVGPRDQRVDRRPRAVRGGRWMRWPGRIRLRDPSTAERCADSSGPSILRRRRGVARRDALRAGRTAGCRRRWINFAPEGYTEDIVATLWG